MKISLSLLLRIGIKIFSLKVLSVISKTLPNKFSLFREAHIIWRSTYEVFHEETLPSDELELVPKISTCL